MKKIASPTHAYKLLPGEAGLFVEVYLPKKSGYQGTLYETLTAGFSIDAVKAHFRNKTNAAKINRLLREFEIVNKYDMKMIDGFPRIFFGYSMYEVDGVFFPDTGRALPDTKRIVEERSQVIRISFFPDYDAIIRDCHGDFRKVPLGVKLRTREIAKAYLRHHVSNIGEFRHFFSQIDPAGLTAADEKVLQCLDRWIDYVALFLFGFIVFQICENVLELSKQNKIRRDQIEKEIWVTSFWNLVVSRVKYLPA